MIVDAIIKDDGLFIPGFKNKFKAKGDKVKVQLTILDSLSSEKDPFAEAAGILKDRNINPLTYQKNLRDEWDR